MSGRPAVALLAACAALLGAVAGTSVARAAAPVTGGSIEAGRAAPLGVDEVVRRALEAHPLVQAASQERAIAAADLQSAEGGFDATWRTRAGVTPLGGYPSGRIDTVVEKPTPFGGTTFFAGYRWGSDDFAVYDGKLETNQLGEIRAGVSAPLWRNGPIDRRRANVERAEAGTDVARWTIAQQRIDVGRAAALRYWEWVAAGHRVLLAERLLAITVARDAGIRARVESGDLPAIEADENQRAILQRRHLVVSAERSREQAAIALSLYLRDARGGPIAPDARRLPRPMPPPPAIPGDDVGALARALGQRPDRARLEPLRRQAEVEERWADNQLAPAIDVFAVGSQDLGEGDVKREPFELELGVLVEIPIERNQAEGRRAAARAALARIDAQESFATEQVLADLHDARSAMIAATRRLEIAGAERVLAERLTTAERDRFDLGESSLLLVNLREQAMLEAQAREVDASADAHRAHAAWLAATGRWGSPRGAR